VRSMEMCEHTREHITVHGISYDTGIWKVANILNLLTRSIIFHFALNEFLV
jgi:hypothetical protein